MPKEIHISKLNELKTKEGKAFHCTFSKFSRVHPGKIKEMAGTIEGNPKTYWWDEQGQCTAFRPSDANCIRHQEYDLDYSQLNGEETKQ